MKRLLLLLFALALMFSLLACNNGDTTDKDSGKTGEENNLNKDENEKGENGGQEGEGKPSGGTSPGLALVQAVVTQFENAASLKVDFSADVLMSLDKWEQDGENYKSSMHVNTVYTATVAKTENGYNLKIDSVTKTNNGQGEKTETVEGVIYVVDGVLYEYNRELGKYDVTVLEGFDANEVEKSIAELESGMNLSTDDVNSLLEAFGVEVISVFNIVSGKGSVTANFKPTFDALLGYIKGIDVETKTVEGVINDVLALIDEGLTADMIVDALATTYAMTLEEFLSALDGSLVSACGMTLQELYQAVVTDQGFESYLVSTLLESGMSPKDIEAYIDSLAKFNINEAIPDEYKKMTMYELTIMLIEGVYGTQEPDSEIEACSSEEVEMPTLDEVVSMVKSILGMTLQELEEMAGLPFSRIIFIAKSLTIDEFNYKIDIKLTDILKIEKISADFNFGMTMKTPSQAAGKEDVQIVDITISVRLYEISNKTVEISVPADKEIIYNNIQGGEF